MDEITPAAPAPITPENTQLAVLKARAVRIATFEVMGEQREEIIRRAKAKLEAMGVAVDLSDGDVSAQVP